MTNELKAKLADALAFAKDNGLQSIEVEGIRMELPLKQMAPPHSPSIAVPEMKAEELLKPMSPFDELTDEEVLFWSTNHYDELQAKKAKHAEHLKQHEEIHGNS